jgi:CheY-like chemotaxis protein
MPSDRPSILVVDDEFSIRDSLYNWFRKDGFAVRAVESAAEALAVLTEQRADVALVDIKMPGRSTRRSPSS